MIQIYTSYFDNIKNLTGQNYSFISIAGRSPDWYNGIEYKVLAPKLKFFKIWKETKDNDYYIENFKSQVLDKLNPEKVIDRIKELSNDKIPVLLCYEKPEEFCHRHLVASWLNDYNAKICQELDIL